MSRIETTTLPSEISNDFYPVGVAKLTRLTGGHTNATYKVIDASGTPSILQRIGPMTDPNISTDYAVIAEHLRQDGWAVPAPHTTRSGELFTLDDTGKPWRAFEFIDSDAVEPAATLQTFRSLGQLVGSMALSLRELDYNVQHSIPHMHDLEHYSEVLRQALAAMPAEDQDFSGRLLELLSDQPPIRGANSVLHGDAKVTNALYKNGVPFAMIDWDNTMHGSFMLDLADMLRSIAGLLSESDPNFTAASLAPIVQAYHRASNNGQPFNELFIDAIESTKTMSLMLSARYMINTVTGQYFQWDPSHVADPVAHSRMRALRQFKNYQALLV